MPKVKFVKRKDREDYEDVEDDENEDDENEDDENEDDENEDDNEESGELTFQWQEKQKKINQRLQAKIRKLENQEIEIPDIREMIQEELAKMNPLKKTSKKGGAGQREARTKQNPAVKRGLMLRKRK